MLENNGRLILTSPFDSGNRGCEGICRGVAQIVQLPVDKIVTITGDVKTDKRVKLDQYITLMEASKGKENIIARLVYSFGKMFIRDEKVKEIYDRIYNEHLAFNNVNRKDIALSNGGDTFCYGEGVCVLVNNVFYSRGIRTVLLTCSFGKENLTKRKYQSLSRFKVLIARESLTAALFKKLFPNKRVYCVPDPAFVLDPEECELPKIMSKSDTVGINLSNYVNKASSKKGFMFKKNVINMIDYILESTCYNIVLIPHVFWKGEDDRIICKQIAERYKDEERVIYYNTFNLNYEQIRYIISKCRFFIGARTHAMISAYAMSVPALALGYSVKSRGIAKDIGLDSKLVVNCKNLQDEDVLREAFSFLVECEEEVRMNYKKNIDNYINNAYKLKDILNQL